MNSRQLSGTGCQKNEWYIGGKDCHRSKCNSKLCTNLTKEYHKVCDTVWNIDCSTLSKQDIDNVIRNIEICAIGRENMMRKCVEPTCRDAGHLGALKKMEKLKTKCEYIKNTFIIFPDLSEYNQTKNFDYEKFVIDVCIKNYFMLVFGSAARNSLFGMISSQNFELTSQQHFSTLLVFEELTNLLISQYATPAYRTDFQKIQKENNIVGSVEIEIPESIIYNSEIYGVSMDFMNKIADYLQSSVKVIENDKSVTIISIDNYDENTRTISLLREY